MIGDAADVPEIPPEVDLPVLAAADERRRRRLLSAELDRREPAERGLSHKYRRRRHCELSADEIVNIAHAVNIQHRFHRDVAEEFGVSVDMVRRIARKGGTAAVEERQAAADARSAQV